MNTLLTQSRLKETYRDIILTEIEFLEVVNSMDSSFNNLIKKCDPAAKRKYSCFLSNLVEDYLTELVTLNEKYIHNVSRIQKKVVKISNAEQYSNKICADVALISKTVQGFRDDPKGGRGGDSGFGERLWKTLEDLFPKGSVGKMDGIENSFGKDGMLYAFFLADFFVWFFGFVSGNF